VNALIDGGFCCEIADHLPAMHPPNLFDLGRCISLRDQLQTLKLLGTEPFDAFARHHAAEYRAPYDKRKKSSTSTLK